MAQSGFPKAGQSNSAVDAAQSLDIAANRDAIAAIPDDDDSALISRIIELEEAPPVSSEGLDIDDDLFIVRDKAVYVVTLDGKLRPTYVDTLAIQPRPTPVGDTDLTNWATFESPASSGMPVVSLVANEATPLGSPVFTIAPPAENQFPAVGTDIGADTVAGFDKLYGQVPYRFSIEVKKIDAAADSEDLIVLSRESIDDTALAFVIGFDAFTGTATIRANQASYGSNVQVADNDDWWLINFDFERFTPEPRGPINVDFSYRPYSRFMTVGLPIVDGYDEIVPSGSGAPIIANPPPADNESLVVYQTINNRRYVAHLDESNPDANINFPLDTVGAEDHFNLEWIEYPWDAALAHLYRAGMKVSICTDTHLLVWAVRKGATLSDKRINPSATNSPAYAQVSVTLL